MAKNKTAYIVLVGSIQDGPQNIPAGQPFTPATTEFAQELLDAGLIGLSPAAVAKEQAAQAAAEAKAQAEAEAEADAAAAADTSADGEGDGEDHDADAGSTTDDAATE